jgi:hypothetical protein
MANSTVAFLALPLDDVEQIFVVLAALYLLECCWWVRGETQRLFTGLFVRWSDVPIERPALEAWRLTFANPCPWSESFSAERAPLPFDDRRLLVPQLDRESGGERYVAFEWDSLEPVAASGRDVQAGSLRLGIYSSHAVAAAIADRLERVRAASPRERASIAAAVVAEPWDWHAAAGRLGRWRRAVSLVQRLGGLLTVLAVAGPLVHAWHAALPPDLPLLLLAIGFVLWIATAVAGVAIRRSELPSDPEARKHRWTAFFSPASAMRLADRMGRDLVAGYEPLVVALIGGERSGSASVAALWLRDAVHPAFRPATTDTSAAATLDWYQGRSTACARQAVADAGHDPESWLGPPRPDRDAVAYCPRCHRQFVDTTDLCGGCGLATLPLPPS